MIIISCLAYEAQIGDIFYKDLSKKSYFIVCNKLVMIDIYPLVWWKH